MKSSCEEEKQLLEMASNLWQSAQSYENRGKLGILYKTCRKFCHLGVLHLKLLELASKNCDKIGLHSALHLTLNRFVMYYSLVNLDSKEWESSTGIILVRMFRVLLICT